MKYIWLETKMQEGEIPQKWKEKKVCVNHPNLLNSQTFQILLVHHPNLSYTVLFNNPPAIMVTVSGKFVFQKRKYSKAFDCFLLGSRKA